ncbi:anti-sigma-I factor RsgI family protein [Ornithinibacillus contaminans]|uniref:anti-sigma-I factor RsgI family protein n=1 Tax=Ornithinibacillus contaminans TaxID=694055 RepID=UPI00064DBDEE|nr:anti-sigma factor domain-containing protein [Ornithinibacillus contaminans]
MKKGIVMEQHRKYTIVMTRDGSFEKANPIQDVEIGVEVDFTPIVKKQFSHVLKENMLTFRMAAIACVLVLLAIPLYMVATEDKTYAYVDIDINPSIELEIEEDLKVSEIIPLNDDAAALLAKIDGLQGENLEKVIDIIVKASEENGYVNDGKNVLVGVHYVNGEPNKNISVLDIIDNHFLQSGTDWKVLTLEISSEIREAAEKNKLSMNKVLAESIAVQEDAVDKVSSDEKEILESFYSDKSKEKMAVEEEPKQKPKQKQDIKTPSTSKEKPKEKEQSKPSSSETKKTIPENKGKTNEKPATEKDSKPKRNDWKDLMDQNLSEKELKEKIGENMEEWKKAVEEELKKNGHLKEVIEEEIKNGNWKDIIDKNILNDHLKGLLEKENQHKKVPEENNFKKYQAPQHHQEDEREQHKYEETPFRFPFFK